MSSGPALLYWAGAHELVGMVAEEVDHGGGLQWRHRQREDSRPLGRGRRGSSGPQLRGSSADKYHTYAYVVCVYRSYLISSSMAPSTQLPAFSGGETV